MTTEPPAELAATLASFVMSETIGGEFLRTIARVTAALGATPHALIGGQAVFFRGYRRFSKEVDIGVASSVREAAGALARAGLAPVEGARLRDPQTGVEVDLVRMPRAVLDRLRRAEVLDLGEGVRAPVIDLASLVALKVKVGRLKDEADVAELLKAGATPDRATVARLLRGLGADAAAYDALVERARREASSPAPPLDDDEDE